MRLLFVEQHPRFIGGSERMSLTLCRHAKQRGHETWLAYAEEGDMVPAYAAAGAHCCQVPSLPVAVRQPLTALRSFTSLWRLARSARIDLLFTSQVNYVSLVAAVGRAVGARTAVHLGLVYDYPSPLFRTGTWLIDLGVAPSAHTAEGWRVCGWPAQSLRVIPNGVDTTAFMPGDGRPAARARLGLVGVQGPVIAYVGRIVREKGILTLMRAFARHRRSRGEGHLMVVGLAPADEASSLTATARDEGVPDHAWEVRPPTPTPEDVYRAADIVVVPSECEEAFGLVPLEAMACGTLAIVSDRAGLPEFVAPLGQDAVFVAGNPEDLRLRLDFWLTDGGRRDRAALQMAAHTRAEYAFDACADAYLTAFQSLVSG